MSFGSQESSFEPQPSGQPEGGFARPEETAEKPSEQIDQSAMEFGPAENRALSTNENGQSELSPDQELAAVRNKLSEAFGRPGRNEARGEEVTEGQIKEFVDHLKEKYPALMEKLKEYGLEVNSKLTEEVKEVTLEDLQKELDELLTEQRRIRQVMEQGGGSAPERTEQGKTLEGLAVKIAVLLLKITIKTLVMSLAAIASLFGGEKK